MTYATALGSLSGTWTRRGSPGEAGNLAFVDEGSLSVNGSTSVGRGTAPTYATANRSHSAASKSPTTEISTFAGSNWAIMHCSTSSSFNESASLLPSDRNRSSRPSKSSSNFSWAAPSIDRNDVSVCCSWPICALLKASGSHKKAPGYKILCTNCSAASTPEHPPDRGGGVGNPKSTVIFSSEHVTSTIMSRSTQNNSTCSLDQGSKAPPSCKVRAPTAAEPRADFKACSPSRPPAIVSRSAPRCASCAWPALASSSPATSANDFGITLSGSIAATSS